MNEYSRMDLRSTYQEPDKIITKSFTEFPADMAISLIEFIPSGYAIMPLLNRHWNQICKRIGKSENPYPIVVKLILEWMGPKEFSCVSRLNKNWKRNCCLTFDYVNNSPFAAKIFALKCFSDSVQLTSFRTISSKSPYCFFIRQNGRKLLTKYFFHSSQNQLELRDYNSQGNLIGFDDQYIIFQKSKNILVFDNPTGKCVRKIKVLKHNEPNSEWIAQIFNLSGNRLIALTYSGHIDQYDLNGKIPSRNLHRQEGVVDLTFGSIGPENSEIVDETLFLHSFKKEITENSSVERNMVIEAYHLGKHQWTLYKEKYNLHGFQDLQGIRSNKTHLFVFFKRSIHCYNTIKGEKPIWIINHRLDFNSCDAEISSNGKYMIISENYPERIRFVCNLEKGTGIQLEDDYNKSILSFWNNHFIVGIFKAPEENVQIFSLWDSITGKLLSTAGKTERDISQGDSHSYIVLPGNGGIAFGIIKEQDSTPDCIKKYLSCCIPFFDKYQHHFKLLKPR